MSLQYWHNQRKTITTESRRKQYYNPNTRSHPQGPILAVSPHPAKAKAPCPHHPNRVPVPHTIGCPPIRWAPTPPMRVSRHGTATREVKSPADCVKVFSVPIKVKV